jgi:hypothetical protein
LQTLLRHVDGLMARCPSAPAPFDAPPAGAGAAAAACQLSALGVAAAWRLGAWQLLRSYLSRLEAAGAAAGPRPGREGGGGGGAWGRVAAALGVGDQWEVSVGALLEAMQRGASGEVGGAMLQRRGL